MPIMASAKISACDNMATIWKAPEYVEGRKCLVACDQTRGQFPVEGFKEGFDRLKMYVKGININRRPKGPDYG